MNLPSEPAATPASTPSPAEPIFGYPPEEDAARANLHQEINARRARVENPELLRRLRGL